MPRYRDRRVWLLATTCHHRLVSLLVLQSGSVVQIVIVLLCSHFLIVLFLLIDSFGLNPFIRLYYYYRDGRYSGPIASSLPVEEQQRLQHYNQMLSGRNIQHPSLSVPGALAGTDRGVRLLPGANGMGMMGGMNRSTMSWVG